MLSIAYITSRRDPCFKWFIDSLKQQTDQVCKSIRIVVVDFHADKRAEEKLLLSELGTNWVWTTPKPSVWQGPHRLTSKDYFAASNARNTALCLAPDGWIAYADDLSVLMPGWLNSVQEAMAGNYVVCGAYRKVKNLLVQNGVVTSFGNGGVDDPRSPEGRDTRLKFVSKDVTECAGGWLYGCSVAGPVEVFLTVNGWPEMCDGAGFEDCCMGVVMKNAGIDIRYDRRMMTYESEELHFIETAMAKNDWHFENGKPVPGGNGGSDKSHSLINIAMQSKRFENYFGEGGIRALRERILKGEPFPVMGIPEHDFYTGSPLKEL